eukprot:tig00000113_g5676.t1
MGAGAGRAYEAPEDGEGEAAEEKQEKAPIALPGRDEILERVQARKQSSSAPAPDPTLEAEDESPARADGGASSTSGRVAQWLVRQKQEAIPVIPAPLNLETGADDPFGAPEEEEDGVAPGAAGGAACPAPAAVAALYQLPTASKASAPAAPAALAAPPDEFDEPDQCPIVRRRLCRPRQAIAVALSAASSPETRSGVGGFDTPPPSQTLFPQGRFAQLSASASPPISRGPPRAPGDMLGLEPQPRIRSLSPAPAMQRRGSQLERNFCSRLQPVGPAAPADILVLDGYGEPSGGTRTPSSADEDADDVPPVPGARRNSEAAAPPDAARRLRRQSRTHATAPPVLVSPISSFLQYPSAAPGSALGSPAAVARPAVVHPIVSPRLGPSAPPSFPFPIGMRRMSAPSPIMDPPPHFPLGLALPDGGVPVQPLFGGRRSSAPVVSPVGSLSSTLGSTAASTVTLPAIGSPSRDAGPGPGPRRPASRPVAPRSRPAPGAPASASGDVGPGGTASPGSPSFSRPLPPSPLAAPQQPQPQTGIAQLIQIMR